ncbi:hypothetical protein [Vibrio sp. Of7-15]|nr:hypothetical protein [Vibrio sp. Of7-15]
MEKFWEDASRSLTIVGFWSVERLHTITLSRDNKLMKNEYSEK